MKVALSIVLSLFLVPAAFASQNNEQLKKAFTSVNKAKSLSEQLKILGLNKDEIKSYSKIVKKAGLKRLPEYSVNGNKVSYKTSGPTQTLTFVNRGMGQVQLNGYNLLDLHKMNVSQKYSYMKRVLRKTNAKKSAWNWLLPKAYAENFGWLDSDAAASGAGAWWAGGMREALYDLGDQHGGYRAARAEVSCNENGPGSSLRVVTKNQFGDRVEHKIVLVENVRETPKFDGDNYGSRLARRIQESGAYDQPDPETQTIAHEMTIYDLNYDDSPREQYLSTSGLYDYDEDELTLNASELAGCKIEGEKKPMCAKEKDVKIKNSEADFDVSRFAKIMYNCCDGGVEDDCDGLNHDETYGLKHEKATGSQPRSLRGNNQ